MSESLKMKLLMLLVCCLGIGLTEAQVSNSTCPHPSCTCDGADLVCRRLKVFPTLPTPNPFTAFFFSACDFETLSRLPSSYSNATELVITNSGLMSVAADAFELLGGLETLELTGNLLANVSKISLSPLKNLVKFDLSYNKLSTLPDELFKDLSKLAELDLGGNHMVFTEHLFKGADALTKLSCNDCHLKDVPTKSLTKIRNLEHLELNENPFQSLRDDTFRGLQQIKELNLDNCSLATISKQAIRPLNTVRLLNFGHNQLRSIPMGTFNYCWNSLKVLYLESNLFTSLDQNLAPWHSLEKVTLGKNPWHCDYHLAWIHSIDMNAFNKENVTCVSPPELQGQSVHVACPPDGTTSRKYLVIGLGSAALVLVVTLTIWWVTCRIRRRYKGMEIKYSQVYGETVSTFDSKQSLVST